jgi:transcriptional regulator with XRE-family HTH domain
MTKLMALSKKPKPRQFIREWRKHRGLTQEQLADRMGITRGYVSQVEKGVRRYDQFFLEAAADAMNCEPADLIMRDPANDAIWSIWDQIPATQREQAVRVLQTFAKKTGTSN